MGVPAVDGAGRGYGATVTDPVQLTIEDGVAVVRLDDGKANAVSHTLLDQVHAALDTAQADATAVAFIGREGRFSAGFDLSVMTQGADATRGLVKAGGELLMRVSLARHSSAPAARACPVTAATVGWGWV